MWFGKRRGGGRSVAVGGREGFGRYGSFKEGRGGEGRGGRVG